MAKKKENNGNNAKRSVSQGLIAQGEANPIVPFSEFLVEKEKQVKEWTGSGPRPRHPDFIENKKPSKESLIPNGYRYPSTLIEQMAEEKIKVYVWYFVTREWLLGELIEVYYSVHNPNSFIYAVVKCPTRNFYAYSFDQIAVPEAVQVKLAA